MKADDLLLVLLIGHGTFDGTDAKFNLVGPDLNVGGVGRAPQAAARAASSSSTRPPRAFRSSSISPARGAIVITATDSRAAVRHRVPRVLRQGARPIRPPISTRTGASRSGRRSPPRAAACGATTRSAVSSRPSMRCSTTTATAGTRGGRGRHRRLGAEPRYLDPDVPGAPPTDEELLALLQKRAALQADVDELKQRRPLMTPDEYQKEFERMMIGCRTVSRESGASRRPESRSVRCARSPIATPPASASPQHETDDSAHDETADVRPERGAAPGRSAMPSDPTPLSSCIRNQMPRKKSAGISTRSKKKKRKIASARATAGRARNTRPSRRQSRRWRRASGSARTG